VTKSKAGLFGIDYWFLYFLLQLQQITKNQAYYKRLRIKICPVQTQFKLPSLIALPVIVAFDAPTIRLSEGVSAATF